MKLQQNERLQIISKLTGGKSGMNARAIFKDPVQLPSGSLAKSAIFKVINFVDEDGPDCQLIHFDFLPKEHLNLSSSSWLMAINASIVKDNSDVEYVTFHIPDSNEPTGVREDKSNSQLSCEGKLGMMFDRDLYNSKLEIFDSLLKELDRATIIQLPSSERQH